MLSWRLQSGLALLLLNAAYLYSGDSPSLFYVINILLHLGLGLLVWAALLWIAKQHFTTVSRMGQLTLLALALSGISGVALVLTGNTRSYQWLLNGHILLSAVGVGAFVVYLVIRRTKGWPVLALVCLLALLIPVGVAEWDRFYPEPTSSIVNPLVVPTSMEEEGAGPSSPFFPSSADTNVGDTIPSNFFMKSESCAQAGCHPDIYKQWASSAHHFSSFNNQWYRKSIEYMQDVVGTDPSKFCGGCHDHAVFFNGMMDQPIKDQLERPEAHVGLACTSCHSIVAVKSSMGNGDFVIEYPPLHDLATSENPLLRNLHDFIVRVDPGPHRSVFMKPFIRNQTAEYCSTCHKVHLDVPVNDYDGWQASGVSGQGARSFYYPKQPLKCVDCHMPLVPSTDAANLDGYVHNHRFPGANTAVPFVNRDEEQLRTVTEFLQNDQIGVDIFALSEVTAEEPGQRPSAARGEPRIASTFAEGDALGFAVGRATGYTEAREVLAPINRVKPRLRRGETVRVDVVVRTKGVGHFFPGGTVDAFDVWVELKAQDEQGKVIFWSGYVPQDQAGRKGPVDPSAHFYRAFLLDEHGNPINKRNAWAARSVLYVRLIPPGAADTVHFRLKIPEDCGDKIRLTAKVNYRKFGWWNTHWAFAGVRDPADPDPEVGPGYDDGNWVFSGDTSEVSGEIKEVPDLPIVTLATSTVVVRIAPSSATLPDQESVLDPADLIRWNDYGIGLLLQGDLRAAEEIFKRVTEIDPDYADGWVNIGRVRVREGRMGEAQEVLSRALKIDPKLAKTHYFMGLTYKQQGKYEEALEHFQQAEEQYPRDRMVLNQMGRILFLQRRFEEAVETLNRVLAIDPEDLQAHYNLMLCHRGLGNQEAAQREQKLYLRFKADESSQAITGDYRRSHPHDNNERQAIHEHGSHPLEKIRSTPSPKASRRQPYRSEGI